MMIVNLKGVILQNYGKLFFLLIFLIIALNCLPLPSIIHAFLAMPMFILLPILFGFGLGSLVLRVKQKDFVPINDTISCLIIYWFLGFFSLFITVYLLLSAIQNILVPLALIFAVCLYGSLKIERLFELSSLRNNRKHLIIFILLIIIGLIPSFIITQGASSFPFPNTRAWITAGYLNRDVSYVTSGIPSSPYESTHPPALSTLYGILSAVFIIKPIEVLWVIPFILTVLLAFGSYLFFKTISGRTDLSFVGSIICTWILSGTNHAEYPIAPEGAYVIYALIPLVFYLFHKIGITNNFSFKNAIISLILGALFSFGLRILFIINREWTITETYFASNVYVSLYSILLALFFTIMILSIFRFNKLSLFIVPMMGLLSLHTIVGLITFLIAFFYIIILKINRGNKDILNKLQYFFQITIFSYIGLQKMGVFEVPFNNSFSSLLFLRPVEGYTIDFKFNQLELGAGQFILILFIIGIFYLYANMNKINRTMLTMLSIVLLIYFLPEFWTYRIMDLLPLFITYPVAMLIIMIVDKKGVCT